MRKLCLMTILAIVFVIDMTRSQDDGRTVPVSTDDVILNLDQMRNILQEKDSRRFRIFYPQFMETITKYWKVYQLNAEQMINNFLDDADSETTWVKANISPNYQSGSQSRWSNIKPKRGYHRALCHFKLCNMGSKRNKYWDAWRMNN